MPGYSETLWNLFLTTGSKTASHASLSNDSSVYTARWRRILQMRDFRELLCERTGGCASICRSHEIPAFDAYLTALNSSCLSRNSCPVKISACSTPMPLSRSFSYSATKVVVLTQTGESRGRRWVKSGHQVWSLPQRRNGPGIASSFGITTRAMVAKGEGLQAWATPTSARMLSRIKASSRLSSHSPARR